MHQETGCRPTSETRARGPSGRQDILFERTCALPATPLSWLSALDRWLCVPAFRRVCPRATCQNMPNKSRPYKRRVPQTASRSLRTRAHSASQPPHSGSKPHSAHSVKDLLARAVPILSRAADQSARQAFWRPWLTSHLPPELPPKITGITERDGTLVVFAESPAWSARLRYALQELQPQIQEAEPDIKEVAVRVLPRSAK